MLFGGDEGVDQAEQLLLGLWRKGFDLAHATFHPRTDHDRFGSLARTVQAEQIVPTLSWTG